MKLIRNANKINCETWWEQTSKDKGGSIILEALFIV
jgi:hypothetical protein